jgi:molecular chaperone DnaJ
MAVQDFYKVLKVNRNASKNEIKEAYRKMALMLHPDRHDGCEIKSEEFKKATEAYQTLSDNSKRDAHDRILNGYMSGNRGSSRKAPPSNYRKVYAPQPPPGFKTFDAKKHYDMHYGDGIMKEEIERARKRAEKASQRNAGSWEYTSPLGEGFHFAGSTGNPYSKTGRRMQAGKQMNTNLNGRVMNDIEYEEGYMNMGDDQMISVKMQIRGRERVTERLNERRKLRRRNRGDPMEGANRDESCIVM